MFQEKHWQAGRLYLFDGQKALRFMLVLGDVQKQGFKTIFGCPEDSKHHGSFPLRDLLMWWQFGIQPSGQVGGSDGAIAK